MGAQPGVNPFFAAPIEFLTGAGRARYQPGNKYGLIGSVATNVATGLPQFRLGSTLAGRQYRGTPQCPTLLERDPMSETLRYLGIPYARLSPRRARELAER